MGLPVLRVERMTVDFRAGRRRVRVVNGVSFRVEEGRILGIVGESGCGKSTVALAIMNLLPSTASITDGEVFLRGDPILRQPESQWRRIRGRRLSMVFQDPMTSLDPSMPVGTQIAEGIVEHFSTPWPQARRDAIELLRAVGIPEPERRYFSYPHELSGGMRQRVVIAAALAGRPDVLLADEPTTALDVTTQAQILRLFRRLLQRDPSRSIVFITHNLGVVAQLCDEVAVMYAGEIVERASVRVFFDEPKHPYSQGLLRSIPTPGIPRGNLPAIAGTVPSLVEPPTGCRFHPRCPFASSVCRESAPPAAFFADDHWARCWLYHGSQGRADGRGD